MRYLFSYNYSLFLALSHFFVLIARPTSMFQIEIEKQHRKNLLQLRMCTIIVRNNGLMRSINFCLLSTFFGFCFKILTCFERMYTVLHNIMSWWRNIALCLKEQRHSSTLYPTIAWNRILEMLGMNQKTFEITHLIKTEANILCVWAVLILKNQIPMRLFLFVYVYKSNC